MPTMLNKTVTCKHQQQVIYRWFRDHCGAHGLAAEFAVMANFVNAQPQADVLPLRMSCNSYTE